MPRTILLTLLFAVLSTVARAQDCCQKVELFGGYSYFNADVRAAQTVTIDAFDLRKAQQGFGINLAYNLKSRLGLVGDISYNWGSVHRGDEKFDTSSFCFLSGSRVSTRDEGLNLFGHALAGGCRAEIGASSSTGFALGFGGGVDMFARRHFAMRLIQADYLPTRRPSRGLDSSGGWNHNFRFQTGVVLSFGGPAK